MTASAHEIRALAFASALVLVVAGVLAGSVQAGNSASQHDLRRMKGGDNPGSYLQPRSHENTSSRCPCNYGLPSGLEPRAVEASVQTAPTSRCPCNVGLPAGPILSALKASWPILPAPKARSLAVAVQPHAGFAWTAAGVGAGAMLGIVLLTAGLGAGLRTVRRGGEAAGNV
jgi:hypothetical protein